jgi:hypothetical protein
VSSIGKTPHCHKNGLSVKYDNEVSFLYLTLSPFLWQWSVNPILDTQPILMTMRCYSYTWHTAQFYDNEVSFLYLTLIPFLWQWDVIPILDTEPILITMRFLSYTWHSSQSYDNEVSFLYLTLSPVLWQWSVLPIHDTQSILMTMSCHSYIWHSDPSLWQWRMDCVSSIGMTLHCHKIGLSVKYRNDTSLS